jgi:hypothetical protein
MNKESLKKQFLKSIDWTELSYAPMV